MTPEELLELMPPVKGEMRTIRKCKNCGELQGRRFIPYGLGRGVTFGGCMCVATDRNQKTELVLETKP